MPELSFKEWVEQKDEEASSSERAQRRTEWLHAYRELKGSIQRWLRDAAGERIQFEDEWVQRNEMGLGIYDIDGFRIRIGDSLVRFVPVSRNVIARIRPPGGGEFPGEGLVDVTAEGRRYRLYRTIQEGKDAWYVVDEDRHAATPLTPERLQEVLMDLMS